MIKKLLALLGLTFLVLIGILLFNTYRFKSKQVNAEVIKPVHISDQSIVNFQKAIQIKTISYENVKEVDTAQYTAFLDFINQAYPLVNSKLKKDVVNNYSLLYTWKGKNPALKPIVLMGHMDVVPVEKESSSQWKADPFSGEIKQDTIWGRGTVDDKITVISILESVEKLLAENYQPERTIYLAFGHDEEISGAGGAKQIAALLKKQGIKAEFVIDEGGLIMDGLVPNRPVALIGIAEKGYLTLDLKVQAHGGHSSTPAKETAIDIMSKTIEKVRNNPFEGKFTASTIGLTEALGPEMPFFLKMIFANRWITKPLIQKEYEKTDGGYAQFHTTIAPTILQSGFKDNVLPTVANATINFRILSGETTEYVLEHVKKAVADNRVTITPRLETSDNPSKVSSTNSFGYRIMAKTLRQLDPNIAVTPFLLTGITDSRYYAGLTDNIYRYVPSHLLGFHDINERIAVKDYKGAIAFYYQLIKNINN